MFRFVCKRVCSSSRSSGRSKGFLSKDSITVARFIETPFLIRPISSKPTNDKSFRVSYLVDSCGLSQEKAVSASKKIHFTTPTKPDSVLTLFREYDFPNIHISKIIQKLPVVLLAKVDETLKPKIEFFNSIGVFGPDLAEIILKDPKILMTSLEKRIIPSVAFLKGIVHTETDVITVIKRTRSILTQDPQKRLVPSIALLRTHGVPDSNILKLLLFNARMFLRTDSFFKNVKETKRREFDPSKFVFLMAVHVLSSLSKSSWDAKCDIYKRWGWSEKEISLAFRLQPMCMGLSEKNIMSTMEFLVNRMGYDPLLISKTPVLLAYSLRKRTIPRLSVIQVLVSNGIVKEDYKISTLMNMSEEDFLRKYVTKFEGKVPELLSVYQGKTNG